MEPQIVSSPLLCSLPKHYDQETRLNSQGAAILIRLGTHRNNLLKKGGDFYWSNLYSEHICDERCTLPSTSLTVTHVEPLMETYFTKPMSLFTAKVASRLHSKLSCWSKCMKMRFLRTQLAQRLNVLPLLGAAVIGGVVQIDRRTRQVHDVAHWSCISFQAIWGEKDKCVKTFCIDFFSPQGFLTDTNEPSTTSFMHWLQLWNLGHPSLLAFKQTAFQLLLIFHGFLNQLASFTNHELGTRSDWPKLRWKTP